MNNSKRLNKHLKIMAVTVVLMFGFAFALVPLYNVLCSVTGLNGKTDTLPTTAYKFKVDTSRSVTVELMSVLNQDMPAEFKPKDRKLTLHPGEYVTTSFWVKNLTDKPMIIQAIPSVSPGLAATHIKKVECFCFQKQALEPGEGMDMALRFTIDPAIPTSVKTLTLAYTLFNL